MGTAPADLAAIVATRLFDGAAMRGPTAVLHRGGRIEALVAPGEVPAGCLRNDLPEGALLAPGFIDVQVNEIGRAHV